MRTANYSEEARTRLGNAVAKARREAGHRWRPSFVRATGVGKRSLEAVERAEPVVGISALEDVGRALGKFWRDWNVDTPLIILNGGAIPPLVALGEPTPAPPAVDEPELLSDEERELWETLRRLPEGDRWMFVDLLRAIERRRSDTDQAQSG